MIIHRLIQVIRFLSQRVIVLYLIAILFTYIFVDTRFVMAVAKSATLSRFRPSAQYLTDFLKKRSKVISIKQFEKYVDYYEKVTQYVPKNADAYGMLGLCYYYLGDYKKAINSNLKSIILNPYYFWTHYNLAVTYYRKGDYQSALATCSRTLEIDPLVTIRVLSASKVYISVMDEADFFGPTLVGNIKNGYTYCNKILVLSHYQLKNYPEVARSSIAAMKKNLGEKYFFLFYEGLAAYELKDYAHAIELFHEVINENPDCAEVFEYLGLSLKQAGKPDMAAKAIERAKELRKDKVVSLLKGEDIEPMIY